MKSENISLLRSFRGCSTMKIQQEEILDPAECLNAQVPNSATPDR